MKLKVLIYFYLVLFIYSCLLKTSIDWKVGFACLLIIWVGEFMVSLMKTPPFLLQKSEISNVLHIIWNSILEAEKINVLSVDLRLPNYSNLIYPGIMGLHFFWKKKSFKMLLAIIKQCRGFKFLFKKLKSTDPYKILEQINLSTSIC